MTNSELKDCPTCKSAHVDIVRVCAKSGLYWVIQCMNCGKKTAAYTEPYKAVVVWNSAKS